MIRSILSPLILSIGILGAGYSVGNAISHFKDFDRYVDVKGLDEKFVKSNQASWQINFSTSSNDLKQIYTTVSKSQNTIIQFLIAQGFKETEIQKQGVSITDNLAISYGQHTTNQPRYTATSGILLLTGNVDSVSKAAQKTETLVELGVVMSSSMLRYSYTDLNSIKPEMLTRATESAKDAAQIFAKNSHSTLGSIKNASQGLFTITSADGGASGYDDGSSMMKKVRVVTTVQFFIQ